MPSTQALISFVIAIQVLEVLPGADMAMTMRNTIRDGRSGGIRTVLGANSSKVFHIILFLVGLSALIAASATAYSLVKLVGAAYLTYFGVRMILVGRGDEVGPAIDGPAGVRQRRPYVQGLFTNLLNPKAVLFTVAFFPQFINARASLAPQVLVLTILLVANGLIWGTGIVFMVDNARKTLSRPSVRRRLDRTFGAVFVALGARVALESR